MVNIIENWLAVLATSDALQPSIVFHSYRERGISQQKWVSVSVTERWARKFIEEVLFIVEATQVSINSRILYGNENQLSTAAHSNMDRSHKSERSQTQKDPYCMIPLTQFSKTDTINLCC